MITEVFVEKLNSILTHDLRKTLLSNQERWELPWPNEDTRNWFTRHNETDIIKSETRISYHCFYSAKE